MIVDRGRIEKALPGYRIGERLGSGQFGLVLAARHRRLRRPAAVKVMEAEGPQGHTRGFAGEARILADLDHPHVVRIFEYVEAEGLCLVVMELLAGGTLTRRHDSLTPPQACAVGLAVAAALEHAHTGAQVVLHRDIKPDNILFAADDTVKVTDFGIAKIFEGTTTTASTRAGTPMYMAPEQIDIGTGRLSPATDLYALGVVLYQLLTGRPPFDPKQPLQALWHQTLTDPPPAMTGVPDPIAAVVLRALEKDPADRHQDAAGFASDLARATTDVHGPGWNGQAAFPLHLAPTLRHLIDPPPPPPESELEPEPESESESDTITDAGGAATTVTDPRSPRPSWWRRAARRRGPRATAAVTVPTLLVGVLLWTVLTPENPAGASPDEISERLAAQATTVAADQPDLARRLAVAAYHAAPTPQAHITALRLLATTSKPLATFTGHDDSVSSVVFSPDGRFLATAGTDDDTARLWDATARDTDVQPLATLHHGNWVTSVVFSPDGRLLATAGLDGTAQVWDATARGPDVPPLATFTGGSGVFSAVFSADGRFLATADYDGTARLWDATARDTDVQPLATFTGHDGSVSEVAFSADGRFLATAGIDGTARVWDATARDTDVQPLATLHHEKWVLDVGFSADGRLLATASDDATARLWDATARDPDAQPLATLRHGSTVSDVVFSPDGRLLATASHDHTAGVWDATTRNPNLRPLATLRHSSDTAVYSVVFSADGRLLATADYDGTARVWDATARDTGVQPLATLTGHDGAINSVVFSPDRRLLATASRDGTARVWDVDAGHLTDTACAEKTNELTEAEWKTVLPEIPYDPPCS